MECVVCYRNVKPSFNHFCRGCYHKLKDMFGVSRRDFRKYLRYGLGVHIHIPEDSNFKQVHDSISEKHPTLFSLANLIENALFLKLVFHKDFDLEANRCYSLNDRHAFANGCIRGTDDKAKVD